MIAAFVLALVLPAGEYEQTLAAARTLFMSERYAEAAQKAKEAQVFDPDDPLSYELRSTALLFLLRDLLDPDRKPRLKLAKCGACPDLIREFNSENVEGQKRIRAALGRTPADRHLQFLDLKLDLNRLWFRYEIEGELSLGLYNEFRSLRKKLAAIGTGPDGCERALVYWAMAEYLTTDVSWWQFWKKGAQLLAGDIGDKKKAMSTLRDVLGSSDVVARDEARFAWWRVLRWEKRSGEAVSVARILAQDYPANPSLQKFLLESK